jgi:hypothetical protein
MFFVFHLESPEYSNMYIGDRGLNHTCKTLKPPLGSQVLNQSIRDVICPANTPFIYVPQIFHHALFQCALGF